MALGITKKVAGGIAVAAIAGLACAGLAFAAAGPDGAAQAPQEPDLLAGSYFDGDGDEYRLGADGLVYENERGRWEAERDLKIEGGQVYELEHGTWQLKDAPVQVSEGAAASTDDVATAEAPATTETAPAADQQQGNAASDAWEAEGDVRIEDGAVYEYDDGAWEVEDDMKVADGIVYEYDDGVWEAEDDMKVENGVVYEYDEPDFDDDYDDDDLDDIDYDDDYDDDDDDDDNDDEDDDD